MKVPSCVQLALNCCVWKRWAREGRQKHRLQPGIGPCASWSALRQVGGLLALFWECWAKLGFFTCHSCGIILHRTDISSPLCPNACVCGIEIMILSTASHFLVSSVLRHASLMLWAFLGLFLFLESCILYGRARVGNVRGSLSVDLSAVRRELLEFASRAVCNPMKWASNH